MRRMRNVFFVFLLAVLTAAAGFGQANVHLVYLSKWNTGETTQVIINDAINDYMTAHPNVTIEAMWSGRNVNTKLMAMVNGGTPPDFYDEDPNLIESSLGKLGLVVDLLPLMKSTKASDQDKMVFDTFPKGFFAPMTYRGQVNTLPIQQYVTEIWYNKTMFKSMGITTLPNTWPQFLALCEKIKQAGTAPIGLDGGVDFYNLYWYSHLADRIMGMNSLMNAVYDKSGKSWDNPGFLQAAKDIAELRAKGYFIKGFEGYQFPAGEIDWAQGKSAMILIHSYMPIEVSKSLPDDFVFGAFPFPSIPGGKGSQYDLASSTGGVCILKTTKDVNVAFDFLKSLASKKVQSRFANEALNVPVILDVPLPMIFSDLGAIMKKQTGSFKDVSGGPGAFEAEFQQQITFPLIDQLMFGKISPEAFVQQTKAKAIEYWQKKSG